MFDVDLNAVLEVYVQPMLCVQGMNRTAVICLWLIFVGPLDWDFSDWFVALLEVVRGKKWKMLSFDNSKIIEQQKNEKNHENNKN